MNPGLRAAGASVRGWPEGVLGRSTRGTSRKGNREGQSLRREEKAQEALTERLTPGGMGDTNHIMKRQDSGPGVHSSHNVCNQPGVRKRVPQFFTSWASGVFLHP